MPKKPKQKKPAARQLPYGHEAELLRLAMSVSAIRQRMNQDLNEREEALDLMRQAYKILLDKFDPEHPDTENVKKTWNH